MTPIEGTRVRPEWRDTLNRLLGTNDWEATLYQPIETPPTGDLFGDVDPTPVVQRVNISELERWVTAGLEELDAG
jgi:hypothetical protein